MFSPRPPRRGRFAQSNVASGRRKKCGCVRHACVGRVAKKAKQNKITNNMAGMIALRGSTTKLRSVDAAHETSAEAPGCQAVLAATSAALSIVAMPAACAVGSPDDSPHNSRAPARPRRHILPVLARIEMCATDESSLGSCACPGERIVLRRGKGRAAQEREGAI